jgi:hypothetical protein
MSSKKSSNVQWDIELQKRDNLINIQLDIGNIRLEDSLAIFNPKFQLKEQFRRKLEVKFFKILLRNCLSLNGIWVY